VRARAAAVTLKEDKTTTNGVIHLKTQVVVSPLSITGSIAQYAERENIDLIVVGTRGRSSFKRLLLGSTASGIVTHAHCPVMVVR
jgi:nucleotide-binding universal stress UspA family protein